MRRSFAEMVAGRLRNMEQALETESKLLLPLRMVQRRETRFTLQRKLEKYGMDSGGDS